MQRATRSSQSEVQVRERPGFAQPLQIERRETIEDVDVVWISGRRSSKKRTRSANCDDDSAAGIAPLSWEANVDARDTTEIRDSEIPMNDAAIAMNSNARVQMSDDVGRGRVVNRLLLEAGGFVAGR